MPPLPVTWWYNIAKWKQKIYPHADLNIPLTVIKRKQTIYLKSSFTFNWSELVDVLLFDLPHIYIKKDII